MNARFVLLLSMLNAGCSSDRASEFRAGPIAIRDAVAAAPVDVGAPEAQQMAVYFSVTNHGAGPDTLDGATSSVAARATMHETMMEGGMAMMHAAPSLVVRADETIRFVPGQTHVMLEALNRRVRAGDTIPLQLHFARAGSVRLSVRVVGYSDLSASLR